MESDGAIALSQCLENKRNFIYGTYIGDGDSKAYNSVKNSIPYGPLNGIKVWVFLKKTSKKSTCVVMIRIITFAFQIFL